MGGIRFRVVAAWTLAILLSMTFLNNAPPKLLGQPDWLQRFAEWGYSDRFASGVGMIELVGAILVLAPSLSFYGAAILAVVMAGAVATHLTSGVGSPGFALQVLIMCLALAALRYPEARWLHADPEREPEPDGPAD